MTDDELKAGISRSQSRCPDLRFYIEAVTQILAFDEGIDNIHQARVQQFLWWELPRKLPQQDWSNFLEACGELFDELNMSYLANIARSEQTATILAEWEKGPKTGTAAFKKAQNLSGVKAVDTEVLEWGSIMGITEARAMDTVEQALDKAIQSGELLPGSPRWRSTAYKITEHILTQPLSAFTDKNLAQMVIEERINNWINLTQHPLLKQLRTSVADKLLEPVELPSNFESAIAPAHWLLEKLNNPEGIELTQSNYLPRTIVVESVEHFDWWPWPKPPRSEADVFKLQTVRDCLNRLRLIRRKGRRLYLTTKGSKLLADKSALWRAISQESEDGTEFIQMMTELVGLSMIDRQQIEPDEIATQIAPIVVDQGWATSDGLLSFEEISSAIWHPFRWWLIFSALDETPFVLGEDKRSFKPSLYSLNSNGKQMVLAHLRSRATKARHQL